MVNTSLSTTLIILFLPSLVLSQTATAFLSTKTNGTNFDVLLDVPARFMWGWADGKRGYCGEASFQSHGILYGNWISQEIARDNADKRELLIDINDDKAAKGLKFNYEKFPSDSNSQQGIQFVEWSRT